MPDIVTLKLAKAYTDQEVAAAIIDAGSGDVVGPASATDSNLAIFSGTTGKLLADSGASVSSFATAAQGAKADSAVQPADIEDLVAGDGITNIVALTQDEYDNLTPDATTLYVIIDG